MRLGAESGLGRKVREESEHFLSSQNGLGMQLSCAALPWNA